MKKNTDLFWKGSRMDGKEAGTYFRLRKPNM